MTLLFFADTQRRGRKRAELICPVCRRPTPLDQLIYYQPVRPSARRKQKFCLACQEQREAERQNTPLTSYQAQRAKCSEHNQWLNKVGNCPACQRPLGVPQEIFPMHMEQFGSPARPYRRDMRADAHTMALCKPLVDEREVY